MEGLSGVDYLIVGTYFVLTIAAGVVLSKKASKGISNYFLGGRTVPWWAIGMSGTASNFDMTGTMVIISFIYAIGLQGFWVSMRGGMALPLGILMVFMGKWLRRSRVMTNAEWMELRFGTGLQGKTARVLSAVSNIIVTMAFLVYFVKGTGKFLSIYLPFSPDMCAVLMIIVAITYTAMSGFYGVIYTDVLQEVLILGASIFIGYKAFTLPDHGAALAFAGPQWSSFSPRMISEPMAWLSNPDIYHFFGLCTVFWIARGIFEGYGGFTGGYMTQRYFAARNDRETGLLTAEWILLILFRWFLIIGSVIIGLSLAAKTPGVAELLKTDPEKTLPIVISQGIPSGIRGMLVAGLIAAAMSTFDSTVNAGVSYWVKDIYQAHVRPKATNRQLMFQSYAGTFAFAAAAVVLGLAVDNINEIWSWITGPLFAGLFAPIILRWYWWRFNGYGFAAATGLGLLTSIALKIAAPAMPFYLSFVYTWAVSLAAGVICSLATAPTDQKTLVSFWRRIKPFGFWSPVVAEVGKDTAREVHLSNVIDILNVPFAIAWHLCGVVLVICLLLHKWTVLGGAAVCYVFLSVLLYFTWYKTLQSKEAAEKEAQADASEQ
ncbi:sodium:solute symporter [Elusimicrobiota bacterium]